MFPWVAAAVVVDVDVELDVDEDEDVDEDVVVDEDVDVDVEPGVEPMLVIGVEALPPQLTNVSAIKMGKQIFT